MRPSIDPISANDTIVSLNNEINNLREQNVKLINEITNLKEYLAEIQTLADSDTLTPLPNRRCFLRELKRVVSFVARHGNGAAVLYVDVDDLKNINDCHGHQAGDAALIHVATMLRNTLRSTDLIARIGGDEFGLLIDPIDEKDVPAKIDSLRAAICASPLMVDGVHVKGSVSIGYTMIRADDDVDTALARADAAMYAVRRIQRSER